MITTSWPSTKSSPMMAEIRECLKKKATSGEATPSRAEANRTWREDILGILSETQKKDAKRKRQEHTARKSKVSKIEEE